MASLRTLDLRLVDQITKKTISGYIREYEEESNAQIPDEIKIVILRFYWIVEKFTLHGDNIKLNEEGNIAAMIDTVLDVDCWLNQYYTVYGNNVIHLDDEHVSIYKWTFKILHGASRYNQPITIGIDSSSNKEELLNEDFADEMNDEKFYAVGLNGWMFNCRGDFSIDEMEDLKNGDTLSIIFDVKKRSLMCTAKNKTHCIAKNITIKDVKYNMAVSMCQKDDSVQLISFETQ